MYKLKVWVLPVPITYTKWRNPIWNGAKYWRRYTSTMSWLCPFRVYRAS